MNGNEAILKRKTQIVQSEDSDREKRRKTIDKVSSIPPIEFPIQSTLQNESGTSHPIGQFLDRSGGLAKTKFVRPFIEELLKERRLKHRFALLTVLQLTSGAMIEELVKNDLLSVLHDWMKDGISVNSPQCIQFMKGILNTLLCMDMSFSETLLGASKWSELFGALEEQELKDIAEKVQEKWKEKQVQVSRRVEGLNSPIPKAPFRKHVKTQFPIPEKVTITIQPKCPNLNSKRVTWAPPESLITVRVFHESDPPDQLFASPKAPCLEPIAPVQKMIAKLSWKEPMIWKLDDSWGVKNGEDSEEKRIQIGRDARVVSVESQPGRTICFSGNPEEPFFNDTYPNPNKPIHVQTL